MYQEIIYEKKEGVAVLTLNRPQRLNAVTPKTQHEVIAAVEEARGDDEVRVLVIAGVDPGFCAGADVAVLAASASGRPAEPPASRAQRLELPWTAYVYNLPKPTIAAVNGVAAGGGLCLALSCDIRIVSERARFTSVWIRRALPPDMGTTILLPRLIGHARAALMMFTGDEVDAREAERIGLANQVVPHEELMPTALALAGRLARGPAVTMEQTKRLILLGYQTPFEAQIGLEMQAGRICNSTEDYKEGVFSFREKRAPQFKGK